MKIQMQSLEKRIEKKRSHSQRSQNLKMNNSFVSTENQKIKALADLKANHVQVRSVKNYSVRF